MALIVEAVGQSGVVERIAVESGAAVINAQPGLTYRILDESGRQVNANATVRRVGDHLIIEGLPEETTVQLTDFFFVCTPNDPCALDLEGLGGAKGETISQISEPIAAMADGSFVLHAPASMATPVAPESEFSAKPALAGLALLAVGGGGGGGGSGGDGPPPPPPGSTTVTSAPFTNDSTPVITGTAVPGSQITITLDIPGSGPVTFNTIADGNGDWSVDTGAATPSAGTMPAGGIPEDAPTTVRVLTAGSTAVVSYQLAIDRVLPDAPVIEAVTGDDVINADEGREANPSPITVQGTAEAGARVRVSWHGDDQIAIADADGRWAVTFDGQKIPDGNYIISAVATDVAGNTGPAANRAVAVATGRPSAPDFDDVAGDNIVNAAETADGVTITGTTSAGTQVFVSIAGLFTDREATVTGTDWSVTVSPAELGQLPDGQPFQVTAFASDGVNRSVASASDPVRVDRTPPAQTPTISQVIDDFPPGTGSVSPGGTTNDSTPQLQGTLSAALGDGESLQVLRGGTVIGTAVVTSTGSGFNWIFNDSVTQDGTHSYTARVIDSAGNAGPSSGAFVLVIDTASPTQTPAITGAIDNVGTVTGPISSGDRTDDPTPELRGTLSGALAAGESLQVLRGGAVVGSANVTNSGSGTTWTFTDSLADDGSYNYTARVIDAAGNTGPASTTFTLTLDRDPPTNTPTITGAFDNVGPVTGLISSGDSTDDISPELRGTLTEPLGSGESVQILRNGTVVGTANVENTGSGATWTFTDSLIEADSYSYTARVVDAAGNTGPSSSSFVLILDTAPTQTVTITQAIDDVPPAIGQLSSGDPTNDPTPRLEGTVSGAVSAGESVQILRNGAVVGTADVDNSGSTVTWTFDDSLTGVGSYLYTARVVDGIGNTGPGSEAFVLQFGTLSIDSLVDDDTTDGGAVRILSSESTANDATPTLNISLSDVLASSVDVIQIRRDGTLVGNAVPGESSDYEFEDELSPAMEQTVVYTAHAYSNGTEILSSAAFMYTYEPFNNPG